MRLPITIAAAALAALAVSAPALAGVQITIDKAAQRMSVAVDGVQKHSWPVSTGRSGYNTPAGNYTAFRMEEDHYSKEWDDAPMPHSIFFTKEGHAIHGSFETKRLGSPASHGCVRLAPANAATLFALVKAEGVTNTKVMITGTEPASAPAVAKRRVPKPVEEAEGMFSSDPYGQRAARDPSGGQMWADPYGQQPADSYAARQRQQQQQYQQQYYQQRRVYDERVGQSYGYEQRSYPYASGSYRNGW
jgi:hypothetical protein